MAIFHHSVYVNLPDVDYPVGEDSQGVYLVGYYRGSSFRCVWRTSNYNKAVDFVLNSSRPMVVFYIQVTSQRLPIYEKICSISK